MSFDQKRYDELQELRKQDLLSKSEIAEWMDLAQLKLFDVIESDDTLMNVFKRLKDR